MRLTMRTALLFAVLGCALHVMAGDANVTSDDDAAISECSNDLDGSSIDVAASSRAAAGSMNDIILTTTTCKHRAAQGMAVRMRVKFSMPVQPSSRSLELRWVCDGATVCVTMCSAADAQRHRINIIIMRRYVWVAEVAHLTPSP